MMDLRDYFHRRCSEMLVMEREIWQLSSLMMQECGYPELKRYFEQHNEPKRQQISNLEQIVDELGGIIGQLEHPVTQGIRRMHRQFLELNPSQALIEVDDALDADKLNNLAVSAYAGLLLLARNLGEEGFVRLLEQNQRAEEEMRSTLQQILPRLVGDFGEQLRHAA
ncbi:MAG: YciE/YciF ferroxidase family protein [Armatimonadota bacterium]